MEIWLKQIALLVPIVLFISFFIGSLIYRILYDHFREKVHSESFYWDTWDGIVVCSATLYKLKYINIYFTEFTGSDIGIENHPKYKEFLKKCKELKNKQK